MDKLLKLLSLALLTTAIGPSQTPQQTTFKCESIDDYSIVTNGTAIKTNVTNNVVVDTYSNQITEQFKACQCNPVVSIDSTSEPGVTNVGCVNTPPPIPTPTPTPVPTPTPTPTPSPTPSPTPTQVIVTFDPAPTSCTSSLCALNGIYPDKGIDWGTTQWMWGGAFQGFTTKNVFFSNATSPFTGNVSRSFTFVNPSILDKLDATSDLVGTLTIKSDQGEVITKSIPSTKTITPVVTGFTKPAKVITVTFTGGWDVDFDNITYH